MNPPSLELVTFFVVMVVIYQLSVATTIFAAAPPVGTIKLGNSSSVPHAIAYNPVNKMMYVGTEMGVAVINSSKNKVVDTIDVKDSNGVAYDSINNMIYTLNFAQGPVVSIIDPSTNHVVGNIRLLSNIPYGPIAYNPANNMIYVTADNGSVFVIKPPMGLSQNTNSSENTSFS